jgi:hypothetical protein
MNKTVKNKFQHTWAFIEKALIYKEFDKQETTLFEEMEKDGWELVQILELEEVYKYYFKKNIS